MSCLICLASDAPLLVLPGPHPQSEACITINRETGAVSVPPEDFWEILPMEIPPRAQSQKQYFAAVDWPRCTSGHSAVLVDYIRRHLQRTEEIELWNLWDGSDAEFVRVRRRSVPFDALTEEDISALFSADIVHPVMLGPVEAFIQYCLVITR